MKCENQIANIKVFLNLRILKELIIVGLIQLLPDFFRKTLFDFFLDKNMCIEYFKFVQKIIPVEVPFWKYLFHVMMLMENVLYQLMNDVVVLLSAQNLD